MPIGKLLTGMSLPIMASMLVQALYNIVDSIFVSRLGVNALAAVSLAFPIQTLLIAVAVGTGVGVNSLISRRLGEKDMDAAATDFVRLRELSEKKEQSEALLEQKMERWVYLSDLAERIEAQKNS